MKKKNRSKNTIISIEQALVKAEQALGKPLETATYEDLFCYIESRQKDGLSATSIHIIEYKIIQFYNYCFDQTDDIKYNKMHRQLKNLIGDKPKAHINPLDILLPEDVKKLINVATLERDRCIVSVLFESGMRIGELLALTNSMIQMDEQKQDVNFNIPKQEGCKTGARTVVCVEVYGYVQDWMKCNTSERFIPMSKSGVSKAVKKLFKKAGIEKPCNVHMFRHSAITYTVNIKMQPNDISMRFWGQVNSNMLATYISLSKQMQADSYKKAKGMNGDDIIVINPLASRCVECGRLIQTGKLCKQCGEIQKLTEASKQAKIEKDRLQVAVSDLVKHVLNLTDKLDAQEVREQIMSQVDNDKSVTEIQDIMSEFDNDNSPEMIKAKEEADKSRKMSLDKLIPISKQ
ncbi:MAG: tyrosine-type recombinase/integrase [Bacteroidales bacterium]|nr:tyrosine-type recombinase/integrase [Bacteroidales bacterium]